MQCQSFFPLTDTFKGARLGIVNQNVANQIGPSASEAPGSRMSPHLGVDLPAASAKTDAWPSATASHRNTSPKATFQKNCIPPKLSQTPSLKHQTCIIIETTLLKAFHQFGPPCCAIRLPDVAICIVSSEKQHETSRDVSGRVLRAKELALAAARYGGVEDHRVGPWHALKECQSPGPAPRETFQKRKLINFSDFRTVNSEKVNNEKNEGLGLRSGMTKRLE